VDVNTISFGRYTIKGLSEKDNYCFYEKNNFFLRNYLNADTTELFLLIA